MARSYNVRIAALITDAPIKWLDNLLSRHHLVGVDRHRQGVERRISDNGLLAVEMCRILALELGLSLRQAVAITNDCLRGELGDELRYAMPSGLTLHFPLGATRARLRDRTREAVEMVAMARRGRPRVAR
ncbi:MAG: hypothetical protein ACREOK_01405 [Gemmatimonadaceae bacterium]